MKAEDRIGKHGQELAAATMRSLGIQMVEKVATPAKFIPFQKGKHPGVYLVIWEQPVSGDHRGILHGGRSVLAEVKTIMDRNLRWSDLREHQPGALTEHELHGGLSLLIWVHASGVHVLRWPVPNFGPGKGIDPEQAERIELRYL